MIWSVPVTIFAIYNPHGLFSRYALSLLIAMFGLINSNAKYRPGRLLQAARHWCHRLKCHQNNLIAQLFPYCQYLLRAFPIRVCSEVDHRADRVDTMLCKVLTGKGYSQMFRNVPVYRSLFLRCRKTMQVNNGKSGLLFQRIVCPNNPCLIVGFTLCFASLDFI